MKKQDKSFQLKRDNVRHFLNMNRLNIRKQTYMKLMGQVVNKVKNGALQDWEITETISSLDEVSDAIKDFKNELLS